jgi:hypothetical protein
MSQTKVLAFDIGIKNLAFCLMENSTIIRLENVNILTPVKKTQCHNCSAAASFTAGPYHSCKRHIPKLYTIIHKSPKVDELKSLAKAQGIDIKKKNKEDLLLTLSKTHAFPYIQPKQPKASTQSLEQIHDALRIFITTYWPDFSQATHVLLENQPAFKNPHMKSVQVLLFTALRERFIQHTQILDTRSDTAPIPKFHLVHAKKKVKDAESGDAGYAERKSKSEQRVKTLLDESTITAISPSVLTNWNTNKKKSDMADAVCMCYDFLAK